MRILLRFLVSSIGGDGRWTALTGLSARAEAPLPAAVDDQFLVFYSKNASWRVPYEKINLIEYGQKVDRRVLAAVLILFGAKKVESADSGQ